MTSMSPARNLYAGFGRAMPDAYTSAWVATVPDEDLNRPAWPSALRYIRLNQLPDGGWGEPNIFHPYDRIISTMAALRALLIWDEESDRRRIERGKNALVKYLRHLNSESYETIGFELIFPRLAHELARYGIDMDGALTSIEQATTQKLELVGSLQPRHGEPRAWWFSMEALSEDQLLGVARSMLTEGGAIAASPSATAAYLRAIRLTGEDVPEASAYLEQLVNCDSGGVAHLWPIDSFELAWTLDAYCRVGFSPHDPGLAPLIKQLLAHWEIKPEGLGYSSHFKIIDGDETAVAYAVLCWAGIKISDKPLLQFWDGEMFHTYLDERRECLSAHVHALSAFRADPRNATHQLIAERILDRVRGRLEITWLLVDKWHSSPFYPTAHLIAPLIGWDNHLAGQITDVLIEHQLPDGGWGWFGNSTLEETSYVVLGLVAAYRNQILSSETALRRAYNYLSNPHRQVATRLWIGKALYQPIGVVEAQLRAARLALSELLS